MQPLTFLRGEVAEDDLAGRGSAEMDVGGLKSHGMEKAEFSAGTAQGGEFDAGAMRAKAAYDPAPAKLNEGIRTADGAVDDGLVENLGRAFDLVSRVRLSPVGRRRDEGFGFAGDASAVPVGDGDVAGVTEAAESGDAMHEAIGNAGGGQKMFDGVDGARRNLGSQGGKRVHFLPEADGIAQFAFGDQAQPLMPLAEDESATLVIDGLAISFEQGVADIFAFERETSGLDGEVGADGEADQIDGVGHRPGFIKVIDSPDEAAFDVAPGAKVFDVEVANRENMR